MYLRTRPRVQAADMRFLIAAGEVTKWNRLRSSTNRDDLYQATATIHVLIISEGRIPLNVYRGEASSVQ